MVIQATFGQGFHIFANEFFDSTWEVYLLAPFCFFRQADDMTSLGKKQHGLIMGFLMMPPLMGLKKPGLLAFFKCQGGWQDF